MQKRNLEGYLIVGVAFVLVLLMAFILKNPSLTGFAVFEQPSVSGGNFDNGTYQNTEWNGSSVVLLSGETSGNYTSKIFDCGSSVGASWNNITWENEYFEQELSDNQEGDLMSGNSLLFHMNDVAIGENPIQDSAGDNDGSPFGDASITAGKLNNAGSFDGNGDYANAGNDNSLDLTQEITISSWINLDVREPSHGFHHSIADRCGDNQNGYWFYVGNNGKLGFLAFTSNNYGAVGSSSDVPVGEWVHVVATYNRTAIKEVKLYINGNLDTHNTISRQVASSNNNLIIGNRGNLHALDGKIDELSIYSRVLNESEISDLYDSGNGYEHAGNEEGLVSVWHMNEDRWRDKIEDTSGNNNDGTAYGDSTFRQDGKLNYSIDFDGAGDYFDLGDDESLYSEDGTISAWIKTTNDDYGTIISFGDDNDQALFSLAVGDGSTGFLDNELITIITNTKLGTENRIGYLTTDRTELFDGNWHNIILTADTEYNFYLDGELKTLSVGVGENNGQFNDIDGIDNSRISSRNTDGSGEGRFFDGKIDEVALWNRSLSEEEIKEIYKKGAVRLNLSARSCDDDICDGETWQDISDNPPVDLSLTNNRYFQYKFSFETGNSDISPLLKNISIDYEILNTAPSLNLVKPQDGTTYGYNESLLLEYGVSDADNNLDSCWYNINQGNNIMLDSCQNTSFNVSSNGNYNLTIYVNDTYSEQVESSAIFSVQIGSPTIIINSPYDVYLAYNNITFKYVPEDIDLSSCELWGDFDGDFALNQTVTNPTNNVENNFSLNLGDGTYKWNIRCNDTQGNSAFNGNKTFYIDTINPDLSISEPSGTKSSRSDIDLDFSVSDASPINCLYNLEWATGGILRSNTSIENCSNIKFDVSADGDYILKLYVNDSAGNKNSTYIEFSVDTSSNGGNGGSSSSSSGGGGGSISLPVPEVINESEFSIAVTELQGIVSRPGETKTLSLEVRNTGKLMQNNCKISAGENYSKWISSDDEKDLNANEKAEFIFTINIPKDTKIGDYSLPLVLKCQDGEENINLEIGVIENKFQISIKEIKEIKKDEIIFSYIIKEVSNNKRDIEINYAIVDYEGNKINEKNEIISLNQGEEKEISSRLSIPVDTIGEYEFVLTGTSEGISLNDKKTIVIAGQGVTGFAGFLSSGRGKTYISIGLLILAAGFLGFFIIRKIIRDRKEKIEEHAGIIKLGQENTQNTEQNF
jgi:hypothetical protein